jgi:flagellar biosynthetic protein FlhB
MSGDAGDRTYEPTEQRKEQFRKEGRIPRARDAGGVVATAAVIGVLAGSEGTLSASARRLFQSTVGDLGALERLGPGAVLRGAALELGVTCGAAVAAAVVAAIVVGLAQTRFRTFSELLGPKLSRLDPRPGLSRLFSLRKAGAETLVALLRVAVVGGVTWYALSRELGLLSALSRMPLRGALPAMLGALGRVAGIATGALVVVTAVDYMQSFFTLAREMKMTRKEREEEAKQSDGDPKAKARMKARARALAKKRALMAVKNADVVVTNPTHVAVALRYGPKDPAPVVIAKGHDEVALRIRAEARRHGIPILENRRLARALDAEVPVGRAVPAAHFAAVARVLAFVYRLRGRGTRPAR